MRRRLETTRFSDDTLTWETSQTTLADLRLKKTELPVLVKITEGYEGVTEELTFSSDQVLLLHQWEEQERVLARKRGGPSLSIPADIEHPMKVVLPAPKGEEPTIEQYTMREAMGILNPPILGRFLTDRVTKYYVNGVPENTVDLRWFRVVSGHFLPYVIASAVNEDAVDLEYLHYIPISRKLKFLLANPMSRFTPSKMRRYLQPFYDEKKHLVTTSSILNALGIAGYADLALTDEDGKNIQLFKSTPWHEGGSSRTSYRETVLKPKKIKRKHLPGHADSSYMNMEELTNSFRDLQYLRDSQLPEPERLSDVIRSMTSPQGDGDDGYVLQGGFSQIQRVSESSSTTTADVHLASCSATTGGSTDSATCAGPLSQGISTSCDDNFEGSHPNVIVKSSDTPCKAGPRKADPTEGSKENERGEIAAEAGINIENQTGGEEVIPQHQNLPDLVPF